MAVTRSGRTGLSVRARVPVVSRSVTATVTALCRSVAAPARDLTRKSLTAMRTSPVLVRVHHHCHFDEVFVTGFSESCRFNNFQHNQ